MLYKIKYLYETYKEILQKYIENIYLLVNNHVYPKIVVII